MSVMCQMNECTKRAGMCRHEAIMAILMMMVVLGGAVYWFLT